MSLNQLILDEFKKWLSIRVNDMTVDGSFQLDDLSTIDLTVENDMFVGNDLDVGNDFTVDGDVEIGGELESVGDMDGSDITLTNDITCENLSGNTITSNTMSVTSSLDTGSTSTGSVSGISLEFPNSTITSVIQSNGTIFFDATTNPSVADINIPYRAIRYDYFGIKVINVVFLFRGTAQDQTTADFFGDGILNARLISNTGIPASFLPSPGESVQQSINITYAGLQRAGVASIDTSGILTIGS